MKTITEIKRGIEDLRYKGSRQSIRDFWEGINYLVDFKTKQYHFTLEQEIPADFLCDIFMMIVLDYIKRNRDTLNKNEIYTNLNRRLKLYQDSLRVFDLHNKHTITTKDVFLDNETFSLFYLSDIHFNEQFTLQGIDFNEGLDFTTVARQFEFSLKYHAMDLNTYENINKFFIFFKTYLFSTLYDFDIIYEEDLIETLKLYVQFYFKDGKKTSTIIDLQSLLNVLNILFNLDIKYKDLDLDYNDLKRMDNKNAKKEDLIDLQKLSEFRQLTSYYFEKLYEPKDAPFNSEEAAYKWLSERLNLPLEKTHVALLNEVNLAKTIQSIFFILGKE